MVKPLTKAIERVMVKPECFEQDETTLGSFNRQTVNDWRTFSQIIRSSWLFSISTHVYPVLAIQHHLGYSRLAPMYTQCWRYNTTLAILG
ncbi:hypothetical protein K493DRAFT_310831 [Basidiobolus meristosporus CBS 931.73]|uniref:Uncharacterized protein n=1 Tax=Basidiobolus meristosporus CBS 931.73 TaxID=1314790 RepID=A0A1Y1Z645_9FUNG|nr:hypothetical protein K493DRAFT_310831 [Basidiobolus meristosporus CBS 931.73]|eukprot:ORY05733.1 hypothetical protein K493DRAFT_310831 [Basidiobolus meristosporus CBS 931.73]